MKPFTGNSYSNKDKFNSEGKDVKVPKASGDRKGTRVAERNKNSGIIEEGLCESLITKHYVLEDVSWWDDNGCDCCEPTFCEAYNFIDEEFSAEIGTVHSVEEAVIEILIWYCAIPEDYPLHEDLSGTDYMGLAKDLGFTWEVL